MTRRVILDVDTGNDDAIAVMLAALHPGIDLLACTTSWGNLPVSATTSNTLRVLDHVGRTDVPVYAGAGERFAPIPFATPAPDNPHALSLPVPPSTRSAETLSAAEYIVRAVRDGTEAVTLVATAPLTNVAIAVKLWPGITDALDELVVMGGGHAFGNVTPGAEANFWNDAVAAQVVLGAGFRKLTLVPLDATHRAIITRPQCRALRELGTRAGVAAASFIESYMDEYDGAQRSPGVAAGAPIHDALCIGYLIDPDLVLTQRMHVDVETMSPLSWGRSVMDAREYGRTAGAVDVAVDADAGSFTALLHRTFGTGRPLASADATTEQASGENGA